LTHGKVSRPIVFGALWLKSPANGQGTRNKYTRRSSTYSNVVHVHGDRPEV